VNAREVNAPPSSLEAQVEYWMDRYFQLQDEYAKLINAFVDFQHVVIEISPEALA
jgi:hypothetical protein